MTNRRARIVYDEEAHFEECNGEARPLTREEYEGNEYYRSGKPISYTEYRDYWGDPERHVYYRTEIQSRCPTCKHWHDSGGTGWIDMMDDSPMAMEVNRWYSAAELGAMGEDYCAKTALKDIEEEGTAHENPHR